MSPVQGLPSGLALRLLAVLCLLSCPRIGGAAGTPTITGYAATNPRGVSIFSAPPGAPLLIEGANFGTSGTVAFGGIPAPPPASWSPTELLVTVPAAAAYPFKGPVTVTTNGQTASGPEFTITPPPPPPPPPVLRPGDLDPSFGAGGKVLTSFGGFTDEASAVVLQPDGRILVAGKTSNDRAQFALARYTVNGSLDPSFGTGGKVLTDFGGDFAQATALVVQPDGRIIAAGSASGADRNPKFALARYNIDGSLDPAFGTGGRIVTDFPNGSNVSALALQPDGRIVAAGSVYPADGDQQFALARYNADGSLDPAFGTGGTVLTDLGSDLSGDSAPAPALALQPDGRLVVAGGMEGNFVLAHYNGSGSLDTSFGTGGKVLTNFGSDAAAAAVAVQPDGRIVAAGGFALARYNANGSLDPAFGAAGAVLTDSVGFHAVSAEVMQPDGRIVVVGSSAANGKYNFALARYNTNGSVDTAFGAGGTVLTDIGGIDVANAVAVQADGRLVVAGWSYATFQPGREVFRPEPFGAGGHFALARYNSDGSLDPSFGTGGMVQTDFGSLIDGTLSVAVQPDGRIVAAGQSSATRVFALARYDTNGLLDTAFGAGGRTATNFGVSFDPVSALALQPNGRIVVAGSSNKGRHYGFALARYGVNGSLDTNFGTRGTVATDLGGGGGGAYSVAVQPDGQIVAAGGVYLSDGHQQFALARYNVSGSLDTAFGSGGTVLTDLGGNAWAYSVALQPDSQVVVAGESNGNGPHGFALARYNAHGSLDSTFGVGGTVLTNFGSGFAQAFSVAVQPDGQIVAAGTYTDISDNTYIALARYQGR